MSGHSGLKKLSISFPCDQTRIGSNVRRPCPRTEQHTSPNQVSPQILLKDFHSFPDMPKRESQAENQAPANSK